MAQVESLDGEPGFELHVVAKELGDSHWNLGLHAQWNDISNATEEDLITRGYAALGWLLGKATGTPPPLP